MTRDVLIAQLHVHLVWWLHWYLVGVGLMTWLTGLDPNPARVMWWVERGVIVRLVEVRRSAAPVADQGGAGKKSTGVRL